MENKKPCLAGASPAALNLIRGPTVINWIFDKIAKKIVKKAEEGYDIAYKREITKVQRGLVREVAEKELKSMLSWKRDDTYTEFTWRDSLRKQIKDAVLNHCYKEASENVNEQVEDYISSEEFIDKIVDRLNRKQIRPGNSR